MNEQKKISRYAQKALTILKKMEKRGYLTRGEWESLKEIKIKNGPYLFYYEDLIELIEIERGRVTLRPEVLGEYGKYYLLKKRLEQTTPDRVRKMKCTCCY